MRDRRRFFAAAVAILAFAALLYLLPGTAAVNAGNGNLPANASAKSYGDGWNCDRGYRESDGSCVEINVPANATATQASYGRGWECRRGFREVNEACIAIEIPANAFLNASGVRWECERGYRETGQSCVKIAVPEHAYLTEASFGSGWKCERGYRPEGNACLRIELPANAHLDYSGNEWECDRLYVKQQDKDICVLR